MATTVRNATLTVTVEEEITLNGSRQGAKNVKRISDINEVIKRIVTATTTEVGLIGFVDALTSIGSVGYLAGIFDSDDVRYMRITNLDDTNHIVLTFKSTNSHEFAIKVDAGHSFIYPGDNSGGFDSTMDASASALTLALENLVDVTVDADTASCDVEVFVASA